MIRHFLTRLVALAVAAVALLSAVSTQPDGTSRAQSPDNPAIVNVARTIGPVTINCGIATCSGYVSRSVTRQAYQKSIVGGGGYAAAASLYCAALALPPVIAACAAAATVQGAWIAQELSDAATQHGAGGACLKVTWIKPAGAITWWSTNNGQYCTD